MADRQKVIQNAEKFVARGRIQAAIEEYRKVLERHPNDTSTLNRVGDLYARLNRMQKAIDLFQQTAESFARQGFFVKSIAIYKKIIRLEPGQIRAYENLADLYNRQGLTNDSLAQYQVVADYYQKHEDLDAAIEVYYNMIKIEPSNPTRRLQLAGLLRQAERLSKALDQYYEIASLMLEHSRGDDALRVLTEALDVDSSNLDFVRKAMHALQDSGFDALASQMLEAAIKRNPQANALRLDSLAGSQPEASVPEVAGEPVEPPVDSVDEPSSDPEPEPAVEPSAAATAAAEEPLQEEATVLDASAVSEVEDTPDEALDEAVDAAAELVAEETAEETAEEIAEEIDSDEVLDLEEPALEFDLSEIAELADAGEIDPVVAASPDRDEEEAAAEDSLILDLDDAVEVDPEFELEDDEATEATAAEEGVEVVEAAQTEARTGPPAPAESLPVESMAAAPESPVDEFVAPIHEPGAQLQGTGTTIKLLIEAEVLSRYGMDVMAVAVLEKVMASEPENAEARGKLVKLLLRLDRDDEALAGANQLADLVAEQGEPSTWTEVCELLAERGFELEDGRFVGELKPKPEPEPEPEAEAEAESEVELAPPAEAAAEVAVIEEIEAEEEEEALSIEELVADAEVLAKPSRRPTSTQDVLAEVIEEIERDEPTAQSAAAEESAAEESQATVEAENSEEWLDDLSAAEEAPASPAEPAVVEDFVDLATELEAELSEEGELDEEELVPSLSEQSLEDIVEGFRKGMAETLSEEDFDTHYNLGVAYSEMGLTDEAIGEFQLAAKDPRYLVESCSLLASCFVEKGFGDLAIQSYENGLASPAIEEEQRLGLLYELGTLLAATGEPEAARQRFVELYGIRSNYRDVVARLEDLRE